MDLRSRLVKLIVGNRRKHSQQKKMKNSEWCKLGHSYRLLSGDMKIAVVETVR